jgi:hypothetical protein
MGSPAHKRNYKKTGPGAEGKFHATKAQKKKRAASNKARRAALRAGKVKKGDGKDVGHIKALSRGGSRSLSNTRIESRSKNRSNGAKLSRGTKGKKLGSRKR